jgi:hypothetical protein
LRASKGRGQKERILDNFAMPMAAAEALKENNKTQYLSTKALLYPRRYFPQTLW